MKNNIGVVQGRLLPKYQGRYQAHPYGYWQKEFAIAQKLGLDCIEFILDFNEVIENPIMSKSGVKEIKDLVGKTGVTVQSVCADFFMEAPLYSKNKSIASQSKEILIQLLEGSKDLGVADIVIPCVDNSSLNTKEEVDCFVTRMLPVVRMAEKFEINLALETDLAPHPFVELIDRFNSNCVSINYDTGNSASFNFNSIEELNTYGDKITSIHIKDRNLGGGPVFLGEGNADFSSFFHKLKDFNYSGPFIMQAYRDEEGIEVFKRQLDYITPFLNN